MRKEESTRSAAESLVPTRHSLFHDESEGGSRQFAFIKSFLAGGIAGAVAKTVVAPFDRTKILMQVSQMYEWKTYRTVPTAMSEIWRSDGFFGFFRGNGAMVARVFPYR